MPRYDFSSPRLYLDTSLGKGTRVVLDASQTNYLGNVLRRKAGDSVLVFNGRDGEWRAILGGSGKRGLALSIDTQSRPQTSALDLHYLFAPLKHARLDYMAQKAVEMGASRLQPIMTRHGQVARLNLERMRANAIEAAEQCGILTLPEIGAPIALDQMIVEREPARLLVFCDEEAEVTDPVAALTQARGRLCPGGARRPAGVAEHGAPCPRPPHSARRYRRGRGACAGGGGARGLAMTVAPPALDRKTALIASRV
jgi:16S rRNA (uracil1498-N3)-methyltransferase